MSDQQRISYAALLDQMADIASYYGAARHDGPSIIEVRTVYQAALRKLARHFDEMIEAVRVDDDAMGSAGLCQLLCAELVAGFDPARDGR